MATKTFEELKQLAIQIRDEKTNKQNTATRVGTAMLEHINKLEQDYYDKTTINNRTSEYNVSINHPTSGISSSNKYDLSSAIAQVPAELRTNGLTVSFLNESGDTEKWEFSGGSWVVGGFSQVGSKKLDELESNISYQSNYIDMYNENGYLDYAGAVASNSNSSVSNFIPVLKGDKFHYKGCRTSASHCCCFYDKDKKRIKDIDGTGEQQVQLEFDVEITDDNVRFVRFCAYGYKNVSWPFVYEITKTESNSTTPSDYLMEVEKKLDKDITETKGRIANSILEWKNDAATTRKQILLDDRKRLIQISYENEDGDIVNEQYIGTSFTDNEWGKDSNWRLMPTGLRKRINRGIHFCGHSIWAGMPKYGYQDRILQYFDFDSYQDISMSGHSLKTLYEDAIEKLTGKKGDIYLIDTTINDFSLLPSNDSVGTIDDYNGNTGLDTYYGALRMWVDKINELTENDNIIVFSSCCHSEGLFEGTTTSERINKVESLSNAGLEVAIILQSYFVDQWNLVPITPYNVRLCTKDGLHLNKYGYQIAVIPWIDVLDMIYYQDNEDK